MGGGGGGCSGGGVGVWVAREGRGRKGRWLCWGRCGEGGGGGWRGWSCWSVGGASLFLGGKADMWAVRAVGMEVCERWGRWV